MQCRTGSYPSADKLWDEFMEANESPEASLAAWSFDSFLFLSDEEDPVFPSDPQAVAGAVRRAAAIWCNDAAEIKICEDMDAAVTGSADDSDSK